MINVGPMSPPASRGPRPTGDAAETLQSRQATPQLAVMGRPMEPQVRTRREGPAMASESRKPKAAAKRRNNARVAAARTIQDREGITFQQALARADAHHRRGSVTIVWDLAALRRCASALDDVSTVLSVHATDSPQIRAASDLATWLAGVVREWPHVLAGERPPFPGPLGGAVDVQALDQAALSLDAATQALDSCQGGAITALRRLLDQLRMWCSRPSEVSPSIEK